VETSVWIPESLGVELLGALPERVVVEVWDGSGPLPPGSSAIAFWVPPWQPMETYARVMAGMPQLRVVQVLTAGYDHVRPHIPAGVTLCNARGVHDSAVSEWVLAAVLAMLRGIPTYARMQREGRVERFETETLAGKTVLILGYGSIGMAVERHLAACEAEVIRVASSPREGVHGPDELGDLLPRAQVVVVLTPLSEATRGMVDAAFLARLPDQALVVNAARGGVVDQEALLAELRSGRLLAALDAADPDPLPAGHPLLAEPGLLYTPHVAGATRMTNQRVYGFVGAQIRRHIAGQPLANVVVPGGG
jgi:phosphoglycerate dehydrogenase-like enzyme